MIDDAIAVGEAIVASVVGKIVVHDVEQLIFGDELGVVLTQPPFDFLKEQLHVIVSNFVLMKH